MTLKMEIKDVQICKKLTRPRPRKQRGSLSLNSLVENAVRMSGGGRAKKNTTTSEQTVSEDFSATRVKLNF